MSERKQIDVGMRVVIVGRHGAEGTVLQLAHRYENDEPTYVKVRFDSIWRRDDWMDHSYVCPIDSPIPEAEVRR